jgi:quercetin dioxygenase-like cupin family protein
LAVTPFYPFELNGTAVDLRNEPFPTVAYTWSPAMALHLTPRGTHFGFVQTGTADVGEMRLAAGMYFAVPSAVSIRGGSGLVVTREGYRGFFHVGGPVEETGRLRYIDGCTDSLLIPPVLLGDPCLNLLHIPPGTRQSAHTHPSIRVGLIVSGRGECVTPDCHYPLTPGLAFVIAANSMHSFHTNDEALRVIAYHPDSDFGPTHECHPMVNRTILPTEKP